MRKEITIFGNVSGNPTFADTLDKSQVTFVRSDNHSTNVDYDHFEMLSNGNIRVGDFDIPDPELNLGTGQWNAAVVNVALKINGVLQEGLTELSVYNDNAIPIVTTDLYTRIDKLGDTVYNWLTYDPSLSGVNGFNPFVVPNDAYRRFRIPCVGLMEDKILSSLSGVGSQSNAVTLTGAEQNITSKKNWYGGMTIDVGSTPIGSGSKLRYMTSSNPINGGIVGYDFGYQDNNRPLHHFYNSDAIFNGSVTSNTLSSTTANIGRANIYKRGNNQVVLDVQADVAFTGLPKKAISVSGGDTNTVIDFHNSDVYRINYNGPISFNGSLMTAHSSTANIGNISVTGFNAINTTTQEAQIGNLHFESSQISAGITTYFNMSPITDALEIGGQATFAGTPTMPGMNIANDGVGDYDFAGEGTLDGSGNLTINTSAIIDGSTSIVMLTYCQNSSSFTIPLGYDNVIGFTSFDVSGQPGRNFKWFLINLV